MKNYLDAYSQHVKTQKHLGTELTKLTIPGSVSFVSDDSKDIAEKERGIVSFVSDVSQDVVEYAITEVNKISLSTGQK